MTSSLTNKIHKKQCLCTGVWPLYIYKTISPMHMLLGWLTKETYQTNNVSPDYQRPVQYDPSFYLQGIDASAITYKIFTTYGNSIPSLYIPPTHPK